MRKFIIFVIVALTVFVCAFSASAAGEISINDVFPSFPVSNPQYDYLDVSVDPVVGWYDMTFSARDFLHLKVDFNNLEISTTPWQDSYGDWYYGYSLPLSVGDIIQSAFDGIIITADGVNYYLPYSDYFDEYHQGIFFPLPSTVSYVNFHIVLKEDNFYWPEPEIIKPDIPFLMTERPLWVDESYGSYILTYNNNFKIAGQSSRSYNYYLNYEYNNPDFGDHGNYKNYFRSEDALDSFSFSFSTQDTRNTAIDTLFVFQARYALYNYGDFPEYSLTFFNKPTFWLEVYSLGDELKGIYYPYQFDHSFSFDYFYDVKTDCFYVDLYLAINIDESVVDISNAGAYIMIDPGIEVNASFKYAFLELVQGYCNVLTIEQNEALDYIEFEEKQQEQKDKADSLMDDMASLPKPAPEEIKPDVDKIISDYADTIIINQYNDSMGVLFDNELIKGMLMVTLVMAFASYVLFGKRK